jgi:hypothetical protein
MVTLPGFVRWAFIDAVWMTDDPNAAAWRLAPVATMTKSDCVQPLQWKQS